MTDYQSFSHGNVTFPLSVLSGNTLLQDADPILFYLLEYYEACIKKHVEPRLMSEVSQIGCTLIPSSVESSAPLSPENFLVDSHFRFPLLAADRKGSKYEFNGQYKNSVSEIEVSYVLPPLGPGEAERLMPILRAVASVLDNRTEQGMDPSYTPTGGTAGGLVWSLAGLNKIEVKSVSYGGYAPTEKLFFPAVVLKVETTEQFDLVNTDFETMAGADVNVDVEDPPTDTTVSDFLQFEVDTTS